MRTACSQNAAYRPLTAHTGRTHLTSDISSRYRNRSAINMDKDLPRPMTPFDEMVSSPELQIIKLLIPYVPTSGRQMLAAFTKISELRETFSLFSRKHCGLKAQSREGSSPSSIIEILDSFRPYLGTHECEMLDMFMRAREMMTVMEMMRNSSADTEGSTASPADAPFDPMNLLTGMLSPDQQEMFHTYSDLFSQTTASPAKGDDTDERMDGPSGNEEHRSREAGTD